MVKHAEVSSNKTDRWETNRGNRGLIRKDLFTTMKAQHFAVGDGTFYMLGSLPGSCVFCHNSSEQHHCRPQTVLQPLP